MGDISDGELAALLVQRLNAILDVDRETIGNLYSLTVPASQALADHEAVQVVGSPGCWALDAIGLINGLCGSTASGGGPRITAEIDQDKHGKLRLVRFHAETSTPAQVQR